MDAKITLGETASGTGATGPGGRPVSIPVRQLTRTIGLIAGEDGWDTTAAIVDALADSGRPVLVLDCDGSFTEFSAPLDARSCHTGPDADCQLKAGSADEIARRAYRVDTPVVVDGRQTKGTTLAALTREMLQRSATDDRPAVTVICGLSVILDDDDPDRELGRAIRRLIRQGPDRHLGVCAVTARPAAVETVVREARSWSLWHHLTRTADTSVVRRELGGERAQAVRDLPPDEAFFETEWTAAVERVSVHEGGREQSPATDSRVPLSEANDETAPAASPERGPPDPAGIADRLEALTSTIEDRFDPDRLAVDIADALEPRLEPAGDDSEHANGSRAVTGSSDTEGSASADGFAGFDLFDDNGAGDEASDAGAESTATDGLAALAGVGNGGDESEQMSTAQNAAAEQAISDGGLDIDGVSAEVASFEDGAAAVETDAERTGGKPAVVVDVESTLAALDASAMEMLEYYRAEGPARPEAAHSAAMDRASRVPAYTLNRQLRRAGLIEHVGRGRYDYSLRERIESGLRADRDEEMVAVYVRDIEQAFLD